MAIQTPLSGTGQVGDPCLNEFYGCSGTVPPASGFLPSPYDPRTVQGSDGCKFFNGCYINVNGQYLRWTNGTVGYVPVQPASELSPAQGYQLLNPQQQSPATLNQMLNPQLPDPAGIAAAKAHPESFISSPGVASPQQIPPYTAPNGGWWLWTGAQYIQMDANNQPVQPGSPAAQPQQYAGGGPATLVQGANNPGVANVVVNVDTTPIASQIDRFITEGQILQKVQAPNVTVQANVDTTPIAQSVDRFISEGQQLQQQQIAATQSQADQIDRFITEGQAAQQSAVVDAVRTALEGNQTQTDFNTSGKNFFDQVTQALKDSNFSPTQFGVELAKQLGASATGALGDQIRSRVDIYSHIFQALMSGDFHSWSDLEATLNQVTQANDIGLKIIDVVALLSIIARVGIIRAEPIVNELSQLSWADNPNRVLDTGSIQEIFKRGLWTEGDSTEELGKQGISQSRAALLLQLAEVFPPIGVIEEGVLRQTITPEDGMTWLAKQGFSRDSVAAIVSLYNKIPPPQDLTRIADKRVWGNQTDPKYGQYAEMPQELVDFLSQWGYSEKWANWLWAAHWNLPSPQQIFDMFHRGVITQDDISQYLGLTDWLPYFRDGLLAISYQVPTRVDARRALHAGIITEEQALQYHEAQGYTPADAAVLVALDKQTSTTDQTAILTKLQAKVQGHVESAYAKGIIDRATATNHLVELGIAPGTAQLMLDVIDHERALEGVPNKTASHTQQAIAMVLHAFGKGTLDFSDAREDLTLLGMSIDQADTELNIQEIERQANLKEKWATYAVKAYGERSIEYPDFLALLQGEGFNGTEVAQLAQEAELLRIQRTKHPSEGEYKHALKKGIIQLPEFYQGMKRLGYQDADLEFLGKAAMA